MKTDHFLNLKVASTKASLAHSLWRMNPRPHVDASYKTRREVIHRPSPNPSEREEKFLCLGENYATAAAASTLKSILSPAAVALIVCPGSTAPLSNLTASGF